MPGKTIAVPQTDPTIPPPILSAYQIDPASVRPMPPGFSGATVWSVRTPRGRRAIKRWPVGTTVDRVARVHAVVCRSSVMPAMDRVGGQTFVQIDGSIFESARWIAGSPAAADDAAARDAGVDWIAKFHAEQGSAEPSTSRVLGDRLRRLDQAIIRSRDGKFQSQLRQLASHDRCEVRSMARWIAGRLPSLLHRQRSSLAMHADQIRPIRWVLRDVHRDHILFRGGEPRAIIDGDAIRRDWAGVDLARWIGSFDVTAGELPTVVAAAVRRWRAALDPAPVAGRAAMRPLMAGSAMADEGAMKIVDEVARDAATVCDLVAVSTFLTAEQWTRWLWIDRRETPGGWAAGYRRWQWWAQAAWQLDQD